MAYTPPVSIGIRSAVTSATIADLSRAILLDVNTYHEARQTSYFSLNELNADEAVPKDSKLYKALQNAFKSAGTTGRNLPIYVGRIEADATILTPVVANNEQYEFTIQVIDTTTGLESVAPTVIVASSDGDAVDTEITAAIVADFTASGITAADAIISDLGTHVSIAPAADRQIIITKVTETLKQSFVSTETAATAYSAIAAEGDDDWYMVCTTQRDIPWIHDLHDVIDATESSDKPKISRISWSNAESLVALTDPASANDLLGQMKDRSRTNCAGEWHDQADEIFPELGACLYNGGFFTGTQNWNGMNNCANPIARHPTLGRQLTTAEIGFITDRNASVRSRYMGADWYFTSKNGDVSKQSVWMDNLQISHWMRLTMKQRVFNLLMNSGNAGIPLTFMAGDRAKVKTVCEGVLNEGVTRKMILGHTGVTVPSNISFVDQAERTLKDIVFTAYFAGKINFINVEGTLTYSEEVGE